MTHAIGGQLKVTSSCGPGIESCSGLGKTERPVNEAVIREAIVIHVAENRNWLVPVINATVGRRQWADGDQRCLTDGEGSRQCEHPLGLIYRFGVFGSGYKPGPGKTGSTGK